MKIIIELDTDNENDQELLEWWIAFKEENRD